MSQKNGQEPNPKNLSSEIKQQIIKSPIHPPSAESSFTPENESQQSQMPSNTKEVNNLRVIRRNGNITPYDDDKITIAITKAFLAVEGNHAVASTRVHETIAQLTKKITDTFQRRMPNGGTIHIEDIQDQVELALMRDSHQKVARSYVLYREERRVARTQSQTTSQSPGDDLMIRLNNGHSVPISALRIEHTIEQSIGDITGVESNLIIADTKRNLFNGATIKDLYKSMTLSARLRIEQEPNYTYAAARLLQLELTQESFEFLSLDTPNDMSALKKIWPTYFKTYIEKAIDIELLDSKLARFDLEKLANAIDLEKDKSFSYLSIQTLYDRYFFHHNKVRFEMPQAFFMRVAMGLSLNEINKEESAIKFYKLLSSFDFMSSTPTLFNSGTLRSQLSSCYLTTIPDDLSGIYDALRDNALLSKFAGGLGNDWTPVRAMGAHIKGTNGQSQGTVPFMKVANDTAVAVNQGGKRKGAVCAYLETWHLDIEEFLELRKNTGDERRRTHDMNTANWIPDLFMQRVMKNESWSLFSPDEAPDLHERYGDDFVQAYLKYEEQGKAGHLRNYKSISAVSLWRKMLSLLFETGHPWITFKDVANVRSPQQHVGVIHSSNLCTEITLNTSQDEIAVCNLGSINLVNHIIDGELNHEKLKETITTAIRMLDNVIDINYYSVMQARRSNLRHRPIGLGLMGFQDALHVLNIPYDSEQAIEFADKSMEIISYYAIEASAKLAEERGPYCSFEGSLWSKGILPIDSISLLAESRGQYLEQNQNTSLDWDSLRQYVKSVGMRNSNVMAIAPTATISNICGVSQSIEPTYQNIFVKSNLSGEFTVINLHLIKDLKALDLWDEVMVNDLKYYNGSVQNIDRIPRDIKAKYKTAFEIEPKWLVECASRRQKWLDQAQSLNLYMSKPSGKKIDELYRLAWTKGLKTTYYLRSLGATNIEKSTVNDRALNAVNPVPTISVGQACSITDPDCEACQ